MARTMTQIIPPELLDLYTQALAITRPPSQTGEHHPDMDGVAQRRVSPNAGYNLNPSAAQLAHREEFTALLNCFDEFEDRQKRAWYNLANDQYWYIAFFVHVLLHDWIEEDLECEDISYPYTTRFNHWFGANNGYRLLRVTDCSEFTLTLAFTTYAAYWQNWNMLDFPNALGLKVQTFREFGDPQWVTDLYVGWDPTEFTSVEEDYIIPSDPLGTWRTIIFGRSAYNSTPTVVWDMEHPFETHEELLANWSSGDEP